MEIERQKDQRKVWVNVDNLFVQQKVEETKRCIKEGMNLRYTQCFCNGLNIKIKNT